MIKRFRNIRAAALLAATFAMVSISATHAASQQATVTVSFTVASHVALTDNCTDNTAGYQFGTVQPGSSVLTDTGANVCSFDFTSTNDTAMLRIFQADQNGQALGSHVDIAENPPRDSNMQVAMTSTTNGWRSGWFGTVDVTTDGGATWTFQHFAGTSLHDIDTFNATTAVAVGDGGTIVRTADGVNWNPVVVGGLTNDIRAVHAVNGTTAWLVTEGGQIWKTTTSGASWVNQPNTAGGNDLFGVDAIDANNAIAVGSNGRVTYTTNGGTNWNAANDGGYYFRDVAMESATNWIALTYRTVRRTTNTGSSYSNMQPADNELDTFVSIINTAASTYIMGGDNGALVRTTDNGATWTTRSTDDTGRVAGLEMIGASDMVALGANGHLTLASADSGATWSVTGGIRSFGGIAASDSSRMVRVGSNGMIERSTNGGENWQSVTSPTTERLWDVASDGDVFVAVGDNGTVLRSADAGNTWASISIGPTDDLFGVDFGTSSDVWAAGRNGRIIYSNDDGASWAPQVSTTTTRFNDIAAGSGLDAHAVDNSGDIYSTSDGSSWARTHDGNWWQPTTSIDMSDAQTAIVGGLWNSLRHTTDSGATWPTAGGWNETDVVVFAPDGGVFTYGNGSVSYGESLTATPRLEYGNDSYRRSAVVVGQQLYLVGDNDSVTVGTINNEINDYAFNSTDWDQGADMFGACLQRLTGANTAADWTEDAANTANLCETDDTDPWNPIPTTPDKIAHTTATGATGTADIVFGVKVDPAQTEAEMYANLAPPPRSRNA